MVSSILHKWRQLRWPTWAAVALLWLLPATTVWAAVTVQTIEITGNSRTTQAALLERLGLTEGMVLEQSDLMAIRQRALDVRQVLLEKIELDETTQTLHLQVKEKWSFYPVPMITQSGSYYRRGLLFFENNFLGTLSDFALGGAFSNSGFNTLFYYQNEHLWSGHRGIKLLAFSQSDLVSFERDGAVYDAYESRVKNALITPSVIWNKHYFKGGPFYMDKQIYSLQGEQLFSKKSAGLLFRHHYKDYTPMEVLYDGYITTYNAAIIENGGHKIIAIHDAEVDFYWPWRDHFFNFMAGGYYSPDQTYFYPKLLGGKKGARGFGYASLPTWRALFAMAQYQHHLGQRFFVAPFVEWTQAKLIEEVSQHRSLSDVTVGAGIHYYFRKITLPALIVDYARNLRDKGEYVHLSVGLQM